MPLLTANLLYWAYLVPSLVVKHSVASLGQFVLLGVLGETGETGPLGETGPDILFAVGQALSVWIPQIPYDPSLAAILIFP